MALEATLQSPLNKTSPNSDTYSDEPFSPSPANFPTPTISQVSISENIFNAIPKSMESKSDHKLREATPTTVSEYLDSPTDCILYLSLIKGITEYNLTNILKKHNIIFDGLIKIYSKYLKTYIEIAAILTNDYLYLTSAIKYQIWQQFKQRSKLNHIITDDNTIIDKEIAIKLAHNLNLLDNNKIIETKIIPYFIGKTKLNIKLDIILNQHSITSMNQLFGLSNDTIANDLKYIQFIGTNKRTHLMDYILMDISYINEETISDNSMVITLKDYFPNYLIDILNDKQNEYFVENKQSNENKLTIQRYNGYKIKYNSHKECKIINLNVFNCVIPAYLIVKFGYGFIVKTQHNKQIISFASQSDNDRFQWITHLDWAIHSQFVANDNNKIKCIDIMNTSNSYTYKLVNDFIGTDTDSKSTQQNYCSNFSFGEHLNYWQNGYDNSVIPIYETLKEELLCNKISKLSQNEYYYLYKECMKILKVKSHEIIADNSGSNNINCSISKGSEITINHLISLKLYTDYNEITKKFKLHFRKLGNDETLTQFIARNREIAHWCRYIKESCIFYGIKSDENLYFYSVFNRKLLFNSMRLQFECALSTVTNAGIAHKLCNDNGIILQLKATDSNTKFFDLSFVSNDNKCEELLITGCDLEIIGIFINGKWYKKYILAIKMFEKIIDGYFIINWKKEIEYYLYILIINCLGWKNEYNTKTPSKYIMALFNQIITRMKRENWYKRLWINMNELNKIQHRKLRCLLIGCGEFFDHFGVNMSLINKVQQFEWNIEKDIFKQFVNLRTREYITSKSYKYVLNEKDMIIFYMKCCYQFSDESNKCAMFLYIDINKLPKRVKAIQIEYDLVCDYGQNNNNKYECLMKGQWLHRNNNFYCGCETFSNILLKDSIFINWIIGIKIINVKYNNTISTRRDVKDKKNINKIARALYKNDKNNGKNTFKYMKTQSEELQKVYESSPLTYYDKQQFHKLDKIIVNNQTPTSESDNKLPTASPTLTIFNSYSREIYESDATAIIIPQNDILKSFDKQLDLTDSGGLYNTSISETFGNSSKYTHYNNEIEKEVNTPGAYNIYYRSYVMNSPTNEKNTNTNIISFGNDVSDTINDLESEQKSIWDISNISNSEYAIENVIETKTDSNYSESTLQQTPIPSERMNNNNFQEEKEEKNEIFKPLPYGWTMTYTNDGMLMYLDHINEIAQFHHPLPAVKNNSLWNNNNNMSMGSRTSIYAVLGSEKSKKI